MVNAVTETTVTATPTHSGATVAFKDGDDTALTNPVTLAEGANVIKAVVTAEDTTTMKTYMVTVTREATTTTAPAIVTGGVQVTSTSMTGDTYGFGETIEITVTFDKAVTVDTSGGTPRIQFRLDGNKNRWAQYSRGSATTALVFTYTVLAGDMDTDGIWLAANLLQLRSGTIRDATDNTVAATLTYDEPGLQTEHKVDGSRTTTVDATLRILRLSGVTLDPTFVSTTETYTATVVNSVTETTVTATPTHSGATVAFKDGADIALTNPVTLAEGANVIKAVVTSEDTTTMKTYMVTVTRGTTTAPEIVADGVQVTSTPMATGDTYGLGETIEITVTFDNAVTVDTSGGTPRIAFRLDGDPNPNRWAEYSRGSEGTALVFTYTVLADDRDDDGIRLPANTIQLFGGTIRAAADNAIAATLTYAEPGTKTGHKVNGSLITTIDDDDETTTTPPAIVTDGGVQVTSTPMATGDTYGLGETIEITVTFDNAVTVDTSGGTPRIAFRLDGDLLGWAVYSSGSGGTALMFTYTVLVDDMAVNGILLAANTIQLFSGTIRDATDPTVDATLTYAAPGLQTGHKVDGSLTTTIDDDDETTTTPPAIVTGGVQVTSTPMATGDTYGLGETIEITVTFDNAVTVDTSGGTPRIAFRLDGDLLGWAVYSSGSGGTALMFTYTVLADDMDDDGIRLPANSIQLFSGTFRDATDPIVDATLTYADPGLQSGHKVDGSLTPPSTMTTRPRPRRPRSSPAACRSPRRRWPRATPTGWARPSQSRSPSTTRSRWTRPAARPGSRSASTGI